MREAGNVDSESLQGANGRGMGGVALRDAPAQTTPLPVDPAPESPADAPPPHLAKARSRVSIHTKLPTEDPPPCLAMVEEVVVDAVLEVDAKPISVKHPVLDKSKDTDPKYSVIHPVTGQRVRIRDDNAKILPGEAMALNRGVLPGTPGPGGVKQNSDRGKQIRKKESEKFSRLIREALRVRMEMKINGVKKDTTWREAMIQQMSHMAATGNLNAMKMLLEYAYGPPPQRTEISGPDGGALRVVFPQQFEGV